MKTEIHRLSLGLSTRLEPPTSCYLIREEGLVLVDAWYPNKAKKFLKETKDLSLEPQDISLILVTHGHWDHIGSLHELKRLTGAAVAINHREKDWVEEALKPLSPGIGLWGKVFAAVSEIVTFFVSFPGTSVDIVLEDEGLSLESYGIRGQVLHTPGHTLGSMSLLLDTGDAFVGDLAMIGLPVIKRPGMPFCAEDVSAVKESWRLLLSRGARWIYPAHGKPFKADVLEKLL